RNVRVNCLAPGLIKTSFSRMLWMDKEKEESMKETLRIRRPQIHKHYHYSGLSKKSASLSKG
ncbi:DHRS4 isoform 8, partial [Pan troglodytes]